MRYHPDKHAHAAEEERLAAEVKFKEINQAYSVMSDPTRRERYDVLGVDGSDDELDEDEGGLEPEGAVLTAEDVFSMFLGIPPGARVKRRHYSTPHVSGIESYLFTVLQLLPALLLAAMALVPPPSAGADFDASSTPFRMRQGGSGSAADALYSAERRTRGAGVAYYVREDFEAVVTRRDDAVLVRVEEAVEVLAKAELNAGCTAEQKQQQKQVDLARRRPKGAERDALLEKAIAFEMPTCDRLSRFGRPAERAGGAAAPAA